MPSFPHWKEEIGKTAFRQAVLAEFCATFIFSECVVVFAMCSQVRFQGGGHEAPTPPSLPVFSTIGCVVFTQDGGITTARQME